MKLTKKLIVLLPDTRDVEISRFGIGNLKIGLGVHTYSRPAGRPHMENLQQDDVQYNMGGTCPGSTDECEAVCYAKRITGVVRSIYDGNMGNDVPPIPDDCQLLRIHVSGDFDTVEYIRSWIARLTERPDVTAWAYTRSWRVPALLPALEELRALPNMQVFASMDAGTQEIPPGGWRRAWLLRTNPREGFDLERRLTLYRTPVQQEANGDAVEYRVGPLMTRCTLDQTPSYVCPEETGRKKDCVSCGYCFEGQKHDVTFLEH